MKTYVRAMTPADARRLLETQVRNRSVSRNTVIKYQTDMREGLWVFNGEPIRFDENGRLLDGQHRLHAVAGMPEEFSVDFLIIEGLPSSSQLSMDQGRKRTAGDQLGLQGVRNGRHVASAVKTIIMYERNAFFDVNTGMRKHSDQVTNATIERWVGENPDETEVISDGISQMRTIDAPASLSGAIHVILRRIEVDQAEDFFRRLSTGADLHLNHPILTLRNRFALIRRDRIRSTDRDYIGMYFTAWNAFRKGRDISRIQRPTGDGWDRSNFPRPI